MALLMGISGVTASREDISAGSVLGTDTEPVNSTHIALEPGDTVPVLPEDGYIVLKKGDIVEGLITGTPFSGGMYLKGSDPIIPVPCDIPWKIVPAKIQDPTAKDHVAMEYTAPDGTYIYLDYYDGHYFIFIRYPDGSYVNFNASSLSGEIDWVHNFSESEGLQSVAFDIIDTENFWEYLYLATKTLICDKLTTPGSTSDTSAMAEKPEYPCISTWASLNSDGVTGFTSSLPDGRKAFISMNDATGESRLVVVSPRETIDVIADDPTTGEIVQTTFVTDGTPGSEERIPVSGSNGEEWLDMTRELLCGQDDAYADAIDPVTFSGSIPDSRGTAGVPGTSLVGTGDEGYNEDDVITCLTKPADWWAGGFSVESYEVDTSEWKDRLMQEGEEPVITLADTSMRSRTITAEVGNGARVIPEDGYLLLAPARILEGPLFGKPVRDGYTDIGDDFVIPVPCGLTWTIIQPKVKDEFAQPGDRLGLEYTAPDGTYIYIEINKKTGHYFIFIRYPDGSYVNLNADEGSGDIDCRYDTGNETGIQTTWIAISDKTNFWDVLYSMTESLICDRVVPDTSGETESVFNPEFPCILTWASEQSDGLTRQTTTLADGRRATIVMDEKDGSSRLILVTPWESIRVISSDPAKGQIIDSIYRTDGSPASENARVISSDIEDEWTRLAEDQLCGAIYTYSDITDSSTGGKKRDGNNPEERIVSEKERTINSQSVISVCDNPDLLISDLSFPAQAEAGEEISITFTVINNGDQASPEVPFSISLPRLLSIDSLGTVPGLNPHETRTVQTTVTLPEDSDGFGQLTIIIDPNETIPECNRLDNSNSNSLMILKKGVTTDMYEKGTKPMSMGRSALNSGSSGDSGGGGYLIFVRD